MNIQKTIGAVALVVVVVAGGWYVLRGHTSNSTAAVAGANEPVATVNGTTIMRSELTALESQIAAQQGLSATSTVVQAQLQSTALDSLIGKALLIQAAQKAGVSASSTQVAAQLASIKASAGSQSSYEKALAAQHMTENDLIARIGETLIINAFLEQQLHLSTLTASDAEIQALYKQSISGQTTGVPKLSEVKSQVSQMVIQQKQSASVNAFVAQLRAAANVQVLIATSTPAV